MSPGGAAGVAPGTLADVNPLPATAAAQPADQSVGDPSALTLRAFSEPRPGGAVLARAHARAGGSAEIVGYLGGKEDFDQAVTEFAVAYADQTERDHAALEHRRRSS